MKNHSFSTRRYFSGLKILQNIPECGYLCIEQVKCEVIEQNSQKILNGFSLGVLHVA